MTFKGGLVIDDVEKAVDMVLETVGNEVIFGMPLALGKPARFVNALYKRAKANPNIKLKILTALALEKPRPSSELERRLVEPLVDRIFGGTPDFDYMLDFRAGTMPPNIELYEFFNKAGGYMTHKVAQQNHFNSNYTHAVRDGVDFGVNVFGQMLAKNDIDGTISYSMGCNPDICLETLEGFRNYRAEGRPCVYIGEVNPNLPYMYGDAIVGGDDFDVILDGPDFDYQLFGPPKDAVALKDHMLGLYVSTLLQDGGTIQVGIGALGDAIVNGLVMRHNNNDEYQKIVKDLGILEDYGTLVDKIGGVGTFDKGLYGSSEMFVDAFMQMYKSGILKRKVFDNIPIMKLINEERLDADSIPENIMELLIEKKAIHKKIKPWDFDFLTGFGILKEGLTYEDAVIKDGETSYNADLRDEANLAAIRNVVNVGGGLKNANVILGAFFLGPKAFYDALNEMSEEERQLFGMSGVDKVNQLYGGEELRALQRKEGRFVNAGMIANLFGAVASDQLEDGRVVSGIGGQYNFVSMAHALPDGRLIMMVRSTRGSGKSLQSNIVFNYGHCSVPKHLRDIIVTEYGIADIRGKADKEVIAAMIRVADSRFQDELIEQAKKSGKLPQDFVLEDKYRNNLPEKIDAKLKPLQAQGHFQVFPFGTDIMPEEAMLGGSLRAFKAKVADSKVFLLKGLWRWMFKAAPEKAMPLLKRMQLEKPSSFQEKMMQKIVLIALENAKMI